MAAARPIPLAALVMTATRSSVSETGVPAAMQSISSPFSPSARALRSDTILCLPTTPFPAPKRGEPLSAASAQRDRILCLCAHGGLTGVPQVSIPGAEVDSLPVGLSIVGGPGTDGTLVAVAAVFTRK